MSTVALDLGNLTQIKADLSFSLIWDFLLFKRRNIFHFQLSFEVWAHNWPQQERSYAEITETTCKTVRFSGIYGLYVNNSVKKHIFSASGTGDRGFSDGSKI